MYVLDKLVNVLEESRMPFCELRFQLVVKESNLADRQETQPYIHLGAPPGIRP